MRRARWATGAIGVAATAALIAGCGGSGGSTASSGSSGASSSGGSASSGTAALTAITRAADVSGSAAGYTVKLALTEASPSLGGTITGTGTGSFNVAKHAGTFALTLDLPSSLAAVGSLELSLISLNGNEYVKLPAIVASRLPGVKPWVEFNVAQLAKSAGLSSLVGGTDTADPAQFLQYLRATSASGIHDVGTATVDGVVTTHYRAILDLAKAPNQLPASERAQAQAAISALEKATGLSTLPVNVWVDSANLVRRIRLSYGVRSSGHTAHTTAQLDFLSYGPQPVPSAPPASQVSSIASLLGSLGAGASSI